MTFLLSKNYLLSLCPQFRFNSFMGAYKFYNQYALKQMMEEILERYEDRIGFVAYI